MSDGITDATETGRQIIEAWKKKTTDEFLSWCSTKELVNELSKREGVKEINLRMACMQDFRGHDQCLVIKE